MEFDAEPMKVIGKDGKIKSVIIGKEDVAAPKHTHTIKDINYPVCTICNEQLTLEDLISAILDPQA